MCSVLAEAWLESIVLHTLGGDSDVLSLTEGHQPLHTLRVCVWECVCQCVCVSVCVCVCVSVCSYNVM